MMRIRTVVAALVLLLVAAPAAMAQESKGLVFVFQKQKDPAKIQSHAQKVSEFLSAELGVPVKTIVPGDYSASVQAIISRQADFAYVSAIPFLLARRDGGASILLAEVRRDVSGKDRTDYDSIIVVRKDSPLENFEDLKAKAAELRFVFTSPTSTSGYIMPYARFVNEGMLQAKQDPKAIFKSVAFGGGYTQALEQLLAGRGDVAAVSDYVLEGPKVDVYLKPEQRQELRILARTSGVPTHLICARGGMDDGLKAKVKAAMLKLAKEKPELLADVYGASSFTEVDENAHVKKAIEAVEYSGLPIEGLAK